jgi:hypothetical protein
VTLLDVGDVAEVNTPVGFADNGETGEIARCSALILAADFTCSIFFADLASGQILAFIINFSLQIIVAQTLGLLLLGGQFDFQLLFGRRSSSICEVPLMRNRATDS